MIRLRNWKSISTMNRNDIKKLIKNEPYKIGHFVGFKDLTPLHNEWLKSFLFSKDDQTLEAHRGSYKTTDLSLFLAIHSMIAPNENCIFFRKTDTDVVEVIKQAKKIMMSGAMQKMAYLLYGAEMKLIKATDTEIDTSLKTTSKGASQVLGAGIKTSITGKHADIVITDDIVNLKDRISKAERELTKAQYMELQNIKNRGGRFINTGTPWHPDDALSLMPNKKIYDCYSTGLIDRETLEKIRKSMTPSLFAANYEMKHIADSDVLFDAPLFTSATELIRNGIAHIDAAYGGSDSTAFSIIKIQSDGTIVAFGKKWDKHVDDCLEEIQAYMDYYRAGTVWCEDNADKGYLKKELKQRGLYAKGYHESMNKFIKISTYLRKTWPDIRFIEDTDPEYLQNILEYNEDAEHDDCPDSLASVIRQSNKKKILM